MNRLDLYAPNHDRRSYWLSVLIGLDQLANTLLSGYADETLSSRAHRCNAKRRWRVTEKIIDALFWFDSQGLLRHCELSYYGELAREHFPRDLSIITMGAATNDNP